MPSIRRLPEELGVSRTTVEAAYQQLCVEGYLKSRPQRGYFVASARLQEKAGTGEVTVRKQTPPAVPVRYDFGTDRIDAETADITIWKRHIRDVLIGRTPLYPMATPRENRHCGKRWRPMPTVPGA